MNSSRRWLLVFAIIIGVLIIFTVSLVLFTKGNKVALLPENTPQGVVQRFLMAVQDRDFQKAYSYLFLSNSGKVTTYDEWFRSLYLSPTSDQSAWKATLGKTTENVDNATVEVTIDTFRPSGPFEDPLRSQQIVFQLSKIDGKWLIISPTYIYWIY
jgi:hypothetical protein